MPALFDWQPVFLSFKVALAALAIVVVIGTSLAHFVVHHRFRGKVWLDTFFTLPLVLPPVVVGYVLLVLFGKKGLIGTKLEIWNGGILFTPIAAVLASAAVAFPLMYISAKAAFSSVDSQLLDVAQSLGASPSRVMWTVALPLARAGLVAGSVLSFARALGEFGATILVAGNIAGQTATMPSAIYSAAENGDLKLAGFYCFILTAFNFCFLMGVNRWTRKN